MVAAEIWGIEAAGGIDHIFYGWIFFGLVILLVMLVALRWFDRPANDVAVDASGLTGRARFAGPAVDAAPRPEINRHIVGRRDGDAAAFGLDRAAEMAPGGREGRGGRVRQIGSAVCRGRVCQDG